MKPEEAKAKAKADAIAAGKSEAEAELLGDVAFHKTEAAYFRGEAQTAFSARDAATAKVKELEAAGMSDVDKMKSRLAELEPTAAEAVALKAKLEAADGAILKLLDIETKDIPEDRRRLIPEGLPATDRLVWLRQAKADGVFGGKSAGNVGDMLPGRAGNVLKRAEFEKLGPKEQIEVVNNGARIVD